MSLDLIATIYGETPQGGTTEAPVALTGVDSVFVGGRNLLPKATETKTLNGVTFTPNPDGSVSVSGTATNDTSYPFKEGLDDSLFDQTVCLSGGSIQTQLVINEKKHSGKWVRNVIVNAKIPAVVGVLSKQADDNILYGTIYVPTGTTVNTTIYPMLNLGNTAMPYEPYQGSVTPLPIPCPLHKVGDVRDVCRTRVKSVYDKRIVLDGAEDWKMGSAVGDGAPYIFCDLLNDHYQAFPIISSRFPSTNILASNKNQGIGCWDRSLYLRYDSLFTNVEELKTYLSAHPLTVYYQSTAYDGTNGLDVCLMKYQTGFVELDGTESNLEHFPEYENLAINGVMSAGSTTAPNVYGTCMSSHFAMVPVGASPLPENTVFGQPKYNRIIIHTSKWNSLETARTYLAAQKAAGTPVQVAYQLATPEVYVTDPLDIYVTTMFPVVVSTGPITYEVIPQIHPFKTDWKIQPKTPEGYYNGDWFEIEDYNHILDNYQTIYKIAKALYPDLQIPTFVSPTLGAPTKASEINTIERTIDAFKTLTIALSDVGATKTWLDNGNLFNFEDINRWEQVALSYYTVFLGQVELLPKLQFKLGGAQF